MSARHIPQDRRDAAVNDYRTSGDPYKVVAARHGVSAASLNAWVNPKVANAQGPWRWPEEDIELTGGRWVICPRRRIQVWETA